jgi:UDP-N-acetylglucosamine:LPS N-acetylglucosamine transferase
MSFAKAGWATVLREQNLDPESLKKAIDHLMTIGDEIRSAQNSYNAGNTPEEILSILSEAATRSQGS